MGIFDKMLGKDKSGASKRPDFSGVRTGSGSTLGEKEQTSSAPTTASSSGSATAGAARSYVVKSGDSLSKIAKQFYGNANEWPKIYEANKDQIKDPDLIFPGQKLIVP